MADMLTVLFMSLVWVRDGFRKGLQFTIFDGGRSSRGMLTSSPYIVLCTKRLGFCLLLYRLGCNVDSAVRMRD